MQKNSKMSKECPKNVTRNWVSVVIKHYHLWIDACRLSGKCWIGRCWCIEIRLHPQHRAMSLTHFVPNKSNQVVDHLVNLLWQAPAYPYVLVRRTNRYQHKIFASRLIKIVEMLKFHFWREKKHPITSTSTSEWITNPKIQMHKCKFLYLFTA